MADKNPEAMSQSREDQKLNTSQEKFEAVKEEGVVAELYEFYLKFLALIEKEGSDLQRFWLSYLQLCELLLNLIFAIRVGDWELYLSCVEEVIPWTFAYDRQKYARYLLPFLDDMRKLPTEKPDVYVAFMQGEFSVQMSTSNPFGRNEADKTIENTINRDCKTSGGYIGFSSSFPATQRWVLNAARQGQYRRLFREQIGLKSKKYVHKEMAPARVQKDMLAVEKVIEVLENVFISPWKGEELLSLSTGVVASLEVKDDLLGAREKGKEACKAMFFRTNS